MSLSQLLKVDQAPSSALIISIRIVSSNEKRFARLNDNASLAHHNSASIHDSHFAADYIAVMIQ
jgi:hypothetical protein